MKYAKFMIGNSSAGIREAQHLKYQLQLLELDNMED